MPTKESPNVDCAKVSEGEAVEVRAQINKKTGVAKDTLLKHMMSIAQAVKAERANRRTGRTDIKKEAGWFVDKETGARVRIEFDVVRHSASHDGQDNAFVLSFKDRKGMVREAPLPTGFSIFGTDKALADLATIHDFTFGDHSYAR